MRIQGGTVDLGAYESAFVAPTLPTTFTLESAALPTPMAGVENDGIQVSAIVTSIMGGEGDNDYYYISNPVDGGAGRWQTGKDFGNLDVFWIDVRMSTELFRVEANDLIRFNATGMIGTEVSLTLYALKGTGATTPAFTYASEAVAQTAFPHISAAQTLRVTVQPPSPTTFDLGSLPNPVAGVENGGGQVSTLVTDVMGGVDGDSYYYISDLVNGGAGTWEENDGTGWNAITGTGLIAVEADDLIRFNAPPGAVAGTVATLDFHVVNASSEPADPEALPFISMAQTLSVTVQSSPSIRRVTTTGDAGNDGSTWANAMTLQAALAASTTAGDQIWIEAGTYKPDATDRAATFTIRGGVTVYGGFAGAEAALADRSGGATILSGDLLGGDMPRPGEGEDGTAYIASRNDNSYSVVRIAGAEATLDGLTITAGERGAAADGTQSGAGLYAVQGATGTVVSNCNFTNNSIAVPGVGFIEYAYGGGAFFKEDAVLTNCTFTGNSAVSTGLETRFPLMFGGGLAFFKGSMATLTGCVFENNNAAYGGGAYFEGGTTLTNCSFTSNNAINNGGGAGFAVEATLTSCVFANNSVTNNGGGGAIFGAESTLTNCIFANNNAVKGGGLNFEAGGTVINSTFYNNTATERGGGVYVSHYRNRKTPLNLRNSILVGNTATTAGNAIYLVDSSTPLIVTDIEATIDHNLIGGGEADLDLGLFDGSYTYTAVPFAAATNVALTNTVEESDATVVFASTDAGHADYLRLKEFSPAVGAGNNDYVNNATPSITTDAVGATRIQAVTVDLGAYESTFATPTPQVITFTLVAVGAVGQSIDLEATTDATGLNVSFAITTEPETGVATLTNNDDGTGTLHLDGAGTVIVTARQDGGPNGEGATYAAATVSKTLTVRVPSIRRVTTIGDAGNDGSTWTQAMTLQAALAVAAVGDQVWIAQGTYKPDATDRTATFRIPTGVLVYGGFVGTDAATDDTGFDPVAGTDGRVRGVDGAFTNETTLSGDLAGDDASRTRTDNSYTVVTIAGADVTLNGLTIEAGEREFDPRVTSYYVGAGLYAGAGTAGAVVQLCTFANNSTIRDGGGAYFTERVMLTGCIFTNNTAGNDGGGAFFTKIATLTGCTFTNNNTNYDHGAGAYFKGTATLTNCTFANNDADDDGGGAYFSTAATLTSCDFTNNNSDSRGGGARFGRSTTVTNCTFTGNTTNGRSSSNGGGAYFSQAGTLVNCVFANNSAILNGGGVSFSSGGTVINTTFYNNTAIEQGGGIYAGHDGNSTTFTLRNSLLIDNTAVDDVSGHQVYVENPNANNTAYINYNLIEGGANGVVFKDESVSAVVELTHIREATDGITLFMSTTVGDDDFLRLVDNTVALNAGNNDYVNMATPPITHDAAGNDRIQGEVGSKLVDLGAYESAFETLVQAPQTIDFTLETEGVVGVMLDLTGTTSSGLAITYMSSETSVAEVGTGDQAGKLILKAIGTATITASQAGATGFMAATAVTQTIRVRESITLRVTTTGTGDGSSWTQAMTLQAALAAANVAGDQIWIAQGIYRPGMADDGDSGTDEREATFRIPEGVLVYGGFVGTDVATDDDGFDPVAGTDGRTREVDGTFTNETILSGDLADNDGTRPVAGAAQSVIDTYTATRDDNSYSVVTLAGKNVWLNGLTIGGGERGFDLGEGTTYVGAGLYAGAGTAGAVVQLCTFAHNNTTLNGGGAYFTESVTLTGCTFNNNTAVDDGGGAFFYRIATLTGCTFNNNTADDDGGGAYFVRNTTRLTDCIFNDNRSGWLGGGAVFEGTATLTDCTFSDNTASSNSSADGGGAYFDVEATLTGCAFTDNTANDDGGGAYFRGIATLTDCIFTDNTTTRISSLSNGGGAYFSKGGTLVNCVVANNRAGFDGGGVYLSREGTVINATFYNNTADNEGGGIFFRSDPATLQNSLFVGNTAEDAASGHQVYVNNVSASHVVTIQHNLLEGGATGATAGIVYWAPGAAGITEASTVDASDPGLVFASTDANDDDYLRLREFSPAVGAGNNDYLSNGTADPNDDIKTDVVGAARIQAVTVDLGAYESAFATPTPQTLMFTSDATGTVGGTITLAATATSMLAVTFAITGQTLTSGTGDVATFDTGTGVLTLENAGTVVITATQTGGPNGGATYAAVTAMQTITVSKQAQTITFSDPSGDMTGTVSDDIALMATTTATGLEVSFAISPAAGVATLADVGDGTGTLTLIGEGTVTVTASQTGDATYQAATDVTRTITVEAAVGTQAQTIDFTLAGTGNVGEDIPLAATAGSGLNVFYTLTTVPPTGVATLTNAGDGTGTLTLTGEGTVTITASQGGNDTYAAAPDVMRTLTVSKQTQAITFSDPSGDMTGTVGNTIALMATTTATGLEVSFAISPATGVATLADVGDGTGTLTLIGEGTVTVTASQGGNDTYEAATDVTRTITVSKQAQTITFSDPASDMTGTVGNTIALMATTNATGLEVSFAISPATGVATLADVGDGTGTLTLTGEGTVTVTASQGGNDTYAAAPDVMRTITVSKQTQAITFSTPAGDMTGTVGNTIALMATTTATGLEVSFAISPTTGVATLADVGDGTGTLTLIGEGTVTVTASQTGDATYQAATDVTRTTTVEAAVGTQAQTIDFTLAGTGNVGEDIPLAATAGSGLNVFYTLTTVPPTGVATLTNAGDGTGTLTLTGEGTVTITASQGGNDTYAAAPDVMRTLTVSKQTQTITFSDPSGDMTGTVGNTIALMATTNATGLEVSFAISPATGVATLADVGDGTGTLTLIGAGTVTITASQGGDATYQAATDVTRTITVEAAVGTQPQTIDFTLAGTGNVGEDIPLAATAGSGLNVFYTLTTVPPTGVATLTNAGDGTGTLTLTGEGTVTITASQGGNDTYAAAPDVMRTITVSKQTQAITFSTPAGDMTGTVGNTIALMATTTATGLEVSFAISPTTGVATLADVGDGTGTLTLIGAGTVTVTASQMGDATYQAAVDVTRTITVEAAVGTQTQAITFSTPAGDITRTVGDNITLEATTNAPGLFVTFSMITTPSTGVATLTDAGDGTGTLTLIGEGTVTIIATRAGNETYQAATPVTRTITVEVASPIQSQTITFSDPAGDMTGTVGDDIALMATTNASGLEVSFAINPATGVATLTDAGDGTGTLTLTGEGMVTVTAMQGGNADYAAAMPVERTITVSPVVLGIEENADGFVLYPNPVSGELHFSEQVAEFRLYGIEGRLLETRKNVRSVDLTARPAGLYFVEVIRNGRNIRYRIIRQ